MLLINDYMQILKNYLVWQYISLGVDIPKKEYYFVKSHSDPGGGGGGGGGVDKK